jgi:hypothetical protein
MPKLLSGFLFLELSLERVFGARAGFGEIAVGAILHGIRVTVTELVCHGIVAALVRVVRLLGTFASIGIIEKMVAGTFCHRRPFDALAFVNDVSGE